MRRFLTHIVLNPQESSPITTISLSADARHLLVALQCSTINCWALGAATAPYPQALDVGKGGRGVKR